MKLSVLALLSLPAIIVAQTLSFDCTVMPEICTNMCWGVHCTAGAFSATLTYDPGTAAIARRRRTSAGCHVNGNVGNRCSTKQGYAPLHNCDEFPFASTKEADNGGQINRCVLSAQNSKQGGALSAFYKGKASGLVYNIAFLNPQTAGVKYCINLAPNPTCLNDGNEHTLGGPALNPAGWTPRLKGRDPAPFADPVPIYLYRLRSGRDMSSAALLPVGEPIHTYKARNATLDALDLPGPQLEEREELELEMDEIVERLM